jgi:hypothetical protein
MRVENLKAELKTSFALLKLEVIQASLVSRIYTASTVQKIRKFQALKRKPKLM